MVGGQAADLMAEGRQGGARQVAGGASGAVRDREAARGAVAASGGGVASAVRDGAVPPAADVALLQAIHVRKTGALLRVSARVGALLAGACEADLECLTTFGTRFGLAFQIADDIKDETAPTSVTGKREGGDRLSGKLTYPALFGTAHSLALLHEEFDAAVAALQPLSCDASLIVQVAGEAVAPAVRSAGA
jgi:geranylgeranyl diphosphate synthase type II